MAAKKNSASDLAMILVIALGAIEHDGVRYEEGEEINLPADAVKPLADVNAVKIVNEAAEDSAAQVSA